MTSEKNYPQRCQDQTHRRRGQRIPAQTELQRGGQTRMRDTIACYSAVSFDFQVNAFVRGQLLNHK